MKKNKAASIAMTAVLMASVFVLADPVGTLPSAHAQLIPGDIIVIDQDAGTSSEGALFT